MDCTEPGTKPQHDTGSNFHQAWKKAEVQPVLVQVSSEEISVLLS